MKTSFDPANPQTWPKGRVNLARMDTTTESELAAQQASDDDSAARDAAEDVNGSLIRSDHHQKPIIR